MRHLKTTLIAAVTLLFAPVLSAQVYINVGVGYGFPAFPELMDVEYTGTQSSDGYKGIYSSLGQGFQPEITFGYRVNPNTGVELGYGFLMGSKLTTDYNDASDPNAVETGTTEMQARMQRLYLGMRFTRGDENVHPYMRMGVVLGIANKVTEETTGSISGPFSSSYNRIEEYDGGLAVGFNSGLGITYHFTDMFGIFFEANLTVQNYSPKHSEITTYTINGQDQLGSMTVRQRETDYVDEYTVSGSPNDAQPSQSLKFHVPMSAWGFGAGVHFWFGGE